MPKRAVLLDVDGTLVNSNEAHARAWVDVGREVGIPIHYEDIRPLVGMGGDKIMPLLAGLQADSPEGQRLAKRQGEIYRGTYLPRVRVFHGTHEMLRLMKQSGLTLVIATSAGQKDLQAMLEHAKLSELIDDHTSAGEVKASKPDPDVVHAALAKAGVPAADALFLGDTPYDIQAATRAGVQCVAVRCGGWWSDAELTGAVAIFDDPAEIVERWTTFAALARP